MEYRDEISTILAERLYDGLVTNIGFLATVLTLFRFQVNTPPNPDKQSSTDALLNDRSTSPLLDKEGLGLVSEEKKLSCEHGHSNEVPLWSPLAGGRALLYLQI